MNEMIRGKVYDIQGFSVHDGPGIRTTVFTMGCPLRCLWCHSPESQSFTFELSYIDLRCVGTEQCGLCLPVCPTKAISKASSVEAMPAQDNIVTKILVDRDKCTNCLACAQLCPSKALIATGYEVTVEEVLQRVLRDKEFYRGDGGVTISGGEPMAQFTFTLELAKQCKENGLHVCLDTTGYHKSEDYDAILPYIDLFLFDLKQMDSKKSQKIVGVPNELILENARRIASKGGKLQIRMPIIPKLNDSKENLRQTAEFCQEIKHAITLVQLLPYHKMGATKYTRIGKEYPLKNVEPPDDAQMQQYKAFFESYGLPVQIH